MEVIPSVHTSQEVVEKTVSLLKDLGKSPIVENKELNGFVLNRLQYAIIMEAWRLVEVHTYIDLKYHGTKTMEILIWQNECHFPLNG